MNAKSSRKRQQQYPDKPVKQPPSLRAQAKQSRNLSLREFLDCFVAQAPRNDATPHSRGAHAPGLLRNPHSLDEEGAGNAGCSAAPAASYAKQKSIRAYVTTGTPRHSGIPRAMVLTVSFEFSPETGLFCLRHPREASASQELDISVGISGPHDFAVRAMSFVVRHGRVHRIPRQRS
jgi:hypothetical protein